ncbi:MAG: hypothetical protein E7326_05160 [Clostridiales bacterium]|nr:hypothetical protein [Clostridiales bacterium]
MKRLTALVMCLVLLMPSFARTEDAENPVRLRALLVGCDNFISQPSTAPAASSNVALLAEALLRDNREYRRIVTERDTVASLEELQSAAAWAYAGADENDISLFYISTHGVYSKYLPSSKAALLLSDGEREYALTAQELYDILAPIPGTKVLILDACHSGAFIGKGLSLQNGDNPFAGEDFKVLCSAGGSEESWYWKGRDDGDPTVQYGASYFASVLSKALSPASAADKNEDGLVTIGEMTDYLYMNYAASTPRMYPQKGDFPLFVYDTRSLPDYRVISGLTFNEDVLLPGQNTLSFSYTLHEEVNVYYQLIYHSRGAWDFDNAQMIGDGMLTQGDTSPGRRARTLKIETDQLDTAGYVMLLLITKENGRLEMQASHLLCVQPAEGKVQLSAHAQSAFTPSSGEENNIVVRHDMPCSLSVSIEDEEGTVIARIAYSQPTRPQAFPGSTFSWDGLMKDGSQAPEGQYRVRVETRTGGEKQTVYSDWFLLQNGET